MIKNIFVSTVFIILCFVQGIYGQELSLSTMQSIWGEPGFARTNDSIIFRVSSVQAKLPGGRSESNKECTEVWVTLPKEADKIPIKDIKVYPTMAISDHWTDVRLNSDAGGWRSVGDANFHRTKDGRILVSVKFCSWHSKEVKVNINVLYKLPTKANYNRAIIDSGPDNPNIRLRR